MTGLNDSAQVNSSGSRCAGVSIKLHHTSAVDIMSWEDDIRQCGRTQKGCSRNWMRQV